MRLPGPLDGEEIGTTDWEDARHWMSIYGDLIEFKRGILERINSDLTMLPPAAQQAAARDLRLIESQKRGYQQRLELWTRRLWTLNGLWLDPDMRMVRYKGTEATLTVLEFQLLRLLLEHPYRYFTVTQILERAWAEPARPPEEVRDHVVRVRKVMAAVGIPCKVVNRPGLGYSLELSADK